jgi:hypothetical protein
LKQRAAARQDPAPWCRRMDSDFRVDEAKPCSAGARSGDHGGSDPTCRAVTAVDAGRRLLPFPSSVVVCCGTVVSRGEGKGARSAETGKRGDRQTDRVGERIYRILSIVRVPVPLAVPCPLFVSRVLPESLCRFPERWSYLRPPATRRRLIYLNLLFSSK